jgi:hypothetical protein
MDRQNELLVSTAGPVIDVYAPPYTGSPVRTITTLPQTSAFAVDATGRHLWLVAGERLQKYSYPGLKLEYASAELPFSPSGLALAPPVNP